MLQQTTRIWSENLARSLNRRSFLKRGGETAFAALAALAAGHALPPLAWANKGPLPPSPDPVPLVPTCAPPGPYCNLNGINEPNGCQGGSCRQHLSGGTVYQCRVVYNWYQAGCWTTAVTGGYWTCCDCGCGPSYNIYCGCAQFSASPAPRPDSPGAGQAA